MTMKHMIAAAVIAAAASPAAADPIRSESRQRGEAVVGTLNAGKSQPALEALRQEFPFLADAITVGVARDDLKEVVYLTTVHAGFPRAIDAAQTLIELFGERDPAGEPR